MPEYIIKILWDAEAAVWIATNDAKLNLQSNGH